MLSLRLMTAGRGTPSPRGDDDGGETKGGSGSAARAVHPAPERLVAIGGDTGGEQEEADRVADDADAEGDLTRLR